MKFVSATARNKIWLGLALVMLWSGAFGAEAASQSQAANQVAQPFAQVPDSYLNAMYGTDKIGDLTHLPRTTISTMPYRHLELRYALEGYLVSKIPLVAFDGSNYFKAGNGDDPGVYYFVPRLAALFDLPLERAIDVFFGTVLIVSFLAGLAGLFTAVNRWPLRLWGAFGLCLLLWFSYRKGDIYIANAVSVVAVVPWLLYSIRKNYAGAAMGAFLFGAGILAGFANELRGQAATGMLIFAAILVAFELKQGWVRKLALLAALFAGFAIPVAFFNGMIAGRNAFLAASEPGYTQTVDHHSIWHALYIGLGYIKGNPYVADYRDEIAVQAVYTISPATVPLSPEYMRILRDEIFRIARQHPGFIAATIFGKLRVIVFLLLCWANAGLLAAALYPKGWAMESAFWAAIGFTSLFGIIAIPQIQYLLGFLAFCMFYGIASLNWALDRRHAGEIARTSQVK
jgi:hypothetical protein